MRKRAELIGALPGAAADHLHRNQAIQTHMAGLVDHSHATFAQLFEENIARDLRSHGWDHREANAIGRMPGITGIGVRIEIARARIVEVCFRTLEVDRTNGLEDRFWNGCRRCSLIRPGFSGSGHRLPGRSGGIGRGAGGRIRGSRHPFRGLAGHQPVQVRNRVTRLPEVLSSMAALLMSQEAGQAGRLQSSDLMQGEPFGREPEHCRDVF